MKCFDLHETCGVACDKKDCRQWIDFDEDLNCTLIAIKKKNYRPMTLREAGERLGVSFVRVKQIEDKVVDRLVKRKKILDP